MKVARASVLFAFLSAPILCTITAHMQTKQQQSPPAPSDEKSKEEAEQGIPVSNRLVIDKCSSCHKKDEKDRLTRISYERATPEGWEMAIKRMVRLNGLTVTPDEAKQIVKYLSNNQGLAPEEARPAFYEAERRPEDEKIPDESLRATCVLCHSLGRVLSQRRTREEWELLTNMHVGLFPVVAFQGFYRFPPPPSAQAPPEPDPRHPVEKAIEYLAKSYPLTTPEWGAWHANMRPPRLEGRWLVEGYQIGRGRLYGEMVVERTSVEDEFTTRASLKYLKDGTTLSRSGRGIVYAGYSWRGRSGSQAAAQPADYREAMFVSRDWSSMDGRWFWGAYDEFGIDVKLRRIAGQPIIAGVDHPALKSPSQSLQLTVYGAELPADIKAGEIDFGPGVTVKRVVSADSRAVTVEVDVADKAANGLRDIALRRYFAPGAIAVYDKVDYIKVLPDAGMARLGGIKFAKQFQPFEAVAYNRGPDGKPQTGDDISLGPVDVDWSIDEFPDTFDDDDKNFVGSLDAHGLFTPSVEGPNPKRRRGIDNYGDVWIVASYKPQDAAKDSAALKARAYLVVTVPLYVRWDTPELSK